MNVPVFFSFFFFPSADLFENEYVQIGKKGQCPAFFSHFSSMFYQKSIFRRKFLCSFNLSSSLQIRPSVGSPCPGQVSSPPRSDL